MNRDAALADAAPVSFWLDDRAAPPSGPTLVGRTDADLTVVGGGYTGLWTALLAKAAEPERDVVLLEADRCGWAASGRNGGFCSASLTHGLANGAERFPAEIDTLERLGLDNLDGLESDLGRWSIECGFERTGELSVATEPHQVAALAEAAELGVRHGQQLTILDREETAGRGALPHLSGRAVGPAGLCPGQSGPPGLGPTDGLCVGGRAHLRAQPGRHAGGHGALGRPGRCGPPPHRGTGPSGRSAVALGTNAYPSLVRRLRRYIVPVYDYVLMTEPLTPAQRAAIGWSRRQGIGGSGNQFLYYRLSADDRILFGGYDAVYHFGNRMGPSLEQRRTTFLLLAGLFAETFPQLEDVRFTHSWAGAIDTCSRFCAFFDRSADGRVVSASGYTGLGVGASRFGARVMLDLLAGERTERTELQFVRSKPIPFPPEPVRSAGVGLTRWSMARADAHGGRRNLWLRTLDRLGMGFDS